MDISSATSAAAALASYAKSNPGLAKAENTGVKQASSSDKSLSAPAAEAFSPAKAAPSAKPTVDILV